MSAAGLLGPNLVCPVSDVAPEVNFLNVNSAIFVNIGNFLSQ